MASNVRQRASGGTFGVGVPTEYPHRRDPRQRQPDHRKTTSTRGKSDPWLSGVAPPPTTALAMHRDQTRVDRLSFGCPALDAVFQGGIPVQGITEIVGEAGAGKTQLCLQLLLQAQLSTEAGGLGGKSYVLTCGEGHFPSRRLRQMAARQQKQHGMLPEKLMDGVCIQNARNLEEQMKVLMEHLPLLMKAHGIKLVVVDSIAALFRSDLGRGRRDMGERSRLLGQLSQQMKRLSDEHRAAFVVVNQVTGKPDRNLANNGRVSGLGPGASVNVPAMGLLWTQYINTRFMLRRTDTRLPLQASNLRADPHLDDQTKESLPAPVAGSGDGSSASAGREISLRMSPCMPADTRCAFVITRDGISGLGHLITA